MKNKLRDIRKAAKVTQRDLAKALDVNIGTIGNWERNKTEPDIHQLWDLAVALNCSPSDIIGWNDSATEWDANEAALIANFRDCTLDRKVALLTMASDAAEASRQNTANDTNETN